MIEKISNFLEKCENEYNGRVSLILKIYRENKLEFQYGYNEHIEMPCASVRKIFILLAFLHFISKNEIGYLKSTFITLKYNEINVKTPFSHTKKNTPFQKEIRNGKKKFSLYEFLFNMIVFSDNTATLALINFCGLDYIKYYCNNILKLKETVHRNAVPKILEINKEYNNKVTTSTVNDVQKVLEAIMFYDEEYLDLSYDFIKIAYTLLSKFIPKKLSRCFKEVNFFDYIGLQKGGTSQKGITDSICVINKKEKKSMIIVIFTDDIKRIYYKELRDEFGKLGYMLISRL